MKPARLAEIRAAATAYAESLAGWHVHELLEEVDRLRGMVLALGDLSASNLADELTALHAARANALEDAARAVEHVVMNEGEYGEYGWRRIEIRASDIIRGLL